MKPELVLSNLRTLLSFEELETQARAAGALHRKPTLHPVMMLEAMLATAGRAGGRLADALRYLEQEHGIDVGRSAFYKRLNETFAKFVHDVMLRVMASRTVAEHPTLRGHLEGFRDLWAFDSTSIALRSALAKVFGVGGNSERAGAKLHAAMSLRTHAVVRPKITAQRVSDERGIDLGCDLDEVLVLLDRGYSRHGLFASIEADGGYYLTRLKASTNPVVTRVHRGRVANAAVKNLTLTAALEEGALAMDREVDLEVNLSLGNDVLPSRVVGIPQLQDGETVMWWYLTNLPRTEYPPEIVRELYRLRWQVELLWKNLKGRFRLDDIEAHTEHNVRLIMESAILAHFLSLGVLDAVTTSAERKKLTVGRMALAFPFALPNIVRLLKETDEDVALVRADKLRRAILRSASDTNPKRTRQAALKRLQKRKSTVIHA